MMRALDLAEAVEAGDLTPAAFAALPEASSAGGAFGLALHALLRGAPDARGQLLAVAQRGDWNSFGVIAAEAELLRLRQ